jgi:hypothetical protein
MIKWEKSREYCASEEFATDALPQAEMKSQGSI